MNRQNEGQSLKSNVGNSAESHPKKDGYLPDDTKTAGAQSVAPLCAKVIKMFESFSKMMDDSFLLQPQKFVALFIIR